MSKLSRRRSSLEALSEDARDSMGRLDWILSRRDRLPTTRDRERDARDPQVHSGHRPAVLRAPARAGSTRR